MSTHYNYQLIIYILWVKQEKRRFSVHQDRMEIQYKVLVFTYPPIPSDCELLTIMRTKKL